MEQNNSKLKISVSDIYERENLTNESIQIQEILRKIKDEQTKVRAVANARASLESYNSPMDPYLELIYDRSVECGGDFYTILAIAGKESGFGRIPYKTYNPFGYLNNVTYSSWEEALSILTCKISQEFIKPCNNNLYCIIEKYGGPETDKEFWVSTVEHFIKNLKNE
ncbi:MAG: hypothetical protein KatS3mg085_536 [Candidatus Dojkabacteria bacterium]|nr:MAG: hypothetical protein KatS3mg085_536 [Candidatus Dojkabacteria bacterium]